MDRIRRGFYLFFFFEYGRYKIPILRMGRFRFTKAFDLNRRRFTEEDIATEEMDTIIEERKLKLRNNSNNTNKNNGTIRNGNNNNKTIWTWDDWFDHIRKKSLEATTTTTTKKGEEQEPGIEVEMIVEASVPPWELSLHRADRQTYQKNPSTFQLPQAAAEMIRFMPEDGDEEEEEEDDPSSDGVGSYLEYLYRRFMEEMITSPVVTNSNNNNHNNNDSVPRTGRTTKSTSWLHCVDVRDLGCQSACRSDSVKEEWNSTVTPNEASELDAADNNKNLPMSRHEKKKKKAAFITMDPSGCCRSNNNHKKNDATAHTIKNNESHGYVPFVPESRGMNPERIELENLRSAGKLVQIHDEDDDESDDDDEDIEEEEEFTYPSFEGFFGQNTYVSFFSSPWFPTLLHCQLVR
mmetsp:Transcript_52100/g.58241  ORF Transcript_52100/g.58241 Transcript_52100/m.58241 type:complete len:407 (+) Transcript_52100:54-1274(+)